MWISKNRKQKVENLHKKLLVSIEGKIKKSERRRTMGLITEIISLFATLIDLYNKTMKNDYPTYQQIYIPVNVTIVIR